MLKWREDYYVGEGIKDAAKARRRIDAGRVAFEMCIRDRSGTILQCRPGCSDRPGYGSIFPFEKRISETSPSCQHADDCNWSGRNEIPGRSGGDPGGSCKRTFPSGTFPYA